MLHVTSPAPLPPPPHPALHHSPQPSSLRLQDGHSDLRPPPPPSIPPARTQPRHHKAVKLTVNAISELRKVEDRQYINLTQDFLVFSLSCTAS